MKSTYCNLHCTFAESPKRVNHLSGLLNIELVEVRAHVRLHVLDHAADVGDVRLLFCQVGRQLRLGLIDTLEGGEHNFLLLARYETRFHIDWQ